MAVLYLTLVTLSVSLYLTLVASAVVVFRPVDVSCKDDSTQCAYYKSTGWYGCNVGSFMYDVCKKTCGYCDGEPIPTPEPGCRDFEKNCPMWVKNGYCKSDHKFMVKYCCLACSKAPAPPKTTTTATTTMPPYDCKDSSPDFCKAKGYEECKFETKKMYEKCKLTCKMCAPGKKCLDLDINCPQYKDMGYCDSSVYSPWMGDHCKFTCLNC